MKSQIIILIITGVLAPFSSAAITFGRSCGEAEKTKVEHAFKDASAMASKVISAWGTSGPPDMGTYFPGVTAAQSAKIKEVFQNIQGMVTVAPNLKIQCIKSYEETPPLISDPDYAVILTPIKCKNREVAFVPLHMDTDTLKPQTTDIIIFCPPFFSNVINKFLDSPTNRKEICDPQKGTEKKSTFKKAPLEQPAQPSTNYAEMIEWMANEFPGRWAFHELTHTKIIGGPIITRGDDKGETRSGTTDHKYGKEGLEKLGAMEAYENADSYAWLAWETNRDACIASGEEEVCALKKRQDKTGKSTTITACKKKPGNVPVVQKPVDKKPVDKKPVDKKPVTPAPVDQKKTVNPAPVDSKPMKPAPVDHNNVSPNSPVKKKTTVQVQPVSKKLPTGGKKATRSVKRAGRRPIGAGAAKKQTRRSGTN